MRAKITKREALKGLTGQTLRELSEVGYRNAEVAERVRNEYTRQYPNQWIAVADETILGPVEDPSELHALLRSQSIDPDRAMFLCLDPQFLGGLIL